MPSFGLHYTSISLAETETTKMCYEAVPRRAGTGVRCTLAVGTVVLFYFFGIHQWRYGDLDRKLKQQQQQQQQQRQQELLNRSPGTPSNAVKESP